MLEATERRLEWTDEATLPSRTPPPRRPTAASVVPEIAIALSLGYLVASFVAFWWGASHPRSAAATYLRSPLPLVPLCVAYLALLCASWSPDTLSLMMPGSLAEGLATGQPQFFPRLDGIMTLLSRRVTASSAWLHIACINFSSAESPRRESRGTANTGGAHAVAHVDHRSDRVTEPLGDAGGVRGFKGAGETKKDFDGERDFARGATRRRRQRRGGILPRERRTGRGTGEGTGTGTGTCQRWDAWGITRGGNPCRGPGS